MAHNLHERLLLLCSVLISEYYSSDQIKKNEMGRACGTNGKQGRCIQGFGGGNMRDGDRSEDLAMDWSIILK